MRSRSRGGGYGELGQLEGLADFNKYQGRSFSLLLIDEAQQYPTPDPLDIMRSNLRSAKSTPIRVVIAANPGGPRPSLAGAPLRVPVCAVGAVPRGQE